MPFLKNISNVYTPAGQYLRTLDLTLSSLIQNHVSRWKDIWETQGVDPIEFFTHAGTDGLLILQAGAASRDHIIYICEELLGDDPTMKLEPKYWTTSDKYNVEVNPDGSVSLSLKP